MNCFFWQHILRKFDFNEDDATTIYYPGELSAVFNAFSFTTANLNIRNLAHNLNVKNLGLFVINLYF